MVFGEIAIFGDNFSLTFFFVDNFSLTILHIGKKRQAKLDELTDGGSKAADITATQFKG